MLNKVPLIIIDESTDARISEALAKAGYGTFSIQQEMPGIDDLQVIELAVKKEACILTEDKDFGDELAYKKALHNGAMLLRHAGVDIENKIHLVLTAIENHSMELIDAFSVLSKNKLRIRK